ncbi:MAG: tetratricopeptide repeat protein [Kiritimatiellae bacterium]|nr:tetratricopeptide repeat protein [Kiritimatiellia bacterium]
MTAACAFLVAALAVLPADRMAMADRQFDRGAYADAKREYAALVGAEGIAADELLYRLAECDRALGDGASACARYGELLDRFPLSRHAVRARLQRALAGTPEERRVELRLLDTDATPDEVRATALYHLGVAANDADAFARSVRLAPKGRYAPYAKFRHASLVANDPDPAVRRSAVGELMEIHFGKDQELGREALYLAATRSYGDKRYGEASSLFRRYIKVYPGDSREANARTMAAWSDYLTGKYADAAALCGEGRTDDAAYLVGACAYAAGDRDRARMLMTRYLESFPDGKYRKAVELPLARMDFDAAEKGDDALKAIEAARRSASISKSASDRLRLAWAYEKAGRDDEAVAEYAAIARDFSGTDDAAEALFRKAMSDMRAKRWSAAELSLAEALASGKNARRKAESLYWRGAAAVQLGHAAEGVGFLKEALSLGLSLDQAREARLMIADADYEAGRLAEAKDAYAKLVTEGACDRMSAAKTRIVGRFLLESAASGDTLDAAKACARALVVHADTAEWRQSAYALLGAAEEAAGEFSSAIESYRSALAEKVRTDDARSVALALGVLESKAGMHGEADRTLKEAVTLNSSDPATRAKAYLWLAKNSESMTDYRGACAYATVVMTLFDDAELADEARKIVEAHPEEVE